MYSQWQSWEVYLALKFRLYLCTTLPLDGWGGDLPQQVVFNVSFLIRYICQTLSVNYNMIPFHEEPLMCSSEL